MEPASLTSLDSWLFTTNIQTHSSLRSYNLHSPFSPTIFFQIGVYLRPLKAWLPKYTHFVKCYLERFASNSDPEKWTTNVAQRKKHLKRDFNNTWHCFVNDVTKHVFLNAEGLQTLILGIFTAKMLPKQCKSLICLEWLEMWFILLAISLINIHWLIFTDSYIM